MTLRAFALLGLILGATIAAPLAAQDFSGLPDALSTRPAGFHRGHREVPAGHVQLEARLHLHRARGNEESHRWARSSLRIGVGDGSEARLGVGSYDWSRHRRPRRDASSSGYEDPPLGVKVRLTRTDTNLLPPGHPALALLLATTVPVGSAGFTADDWQPDGKLALGWDFTDRFSLGSTLIYAYASDGGERFDQIVASLSAGFALNDRLGGYLEGYGFSKESADGSATPYADAGLA